MNMFKAIQSNNFKKVNELIESVNELDHHGNTPLMTAIRKHTIDMKIINLLIEKSIDINLVNNRGESALAIIFDMYKNNHRDKNIIEIIYLLISKKANTNILTFKGDTPINLAYYFDDCGLLKNLIESGADITLHDSSGRSLIELANFLSTTYIPNRIVRSYRSDQIPQCRLVLNRQIEKLRESIKHIFYNKTNIYGIGPIQILLEYSGFPYAINNVITGGSIYYKKLLKYQIKNYKRLSDFVDNL